MNAPDRPHWTLNSSFGAFHTICVNLGPLGCLTKLGAKHSELVQKFVPRCCFESFHNERTRSTPLDPKLMFWSVSYHLGAFGIVKLPNGTRGQTFRTSAKVREFFRNDRTLSTPLVAKLIFWCVSYHLCVFATIWLPYETRGKTF